MFNTLPFKSFLETWQLVLCHLQGPITQLLWPEREIKTDAGEFSREAKRGICFWPGWTPKKRQTIANDHFSASF